MPVSIIVNFNFNVNVRYNKSMMNNEINCNSCGRKFPINQCPSQCTCGAYFSEYDYTLPACIRNKDPECKAKAVIANKTVEKVSNMEGICDAFVHVLENNTTYYLDSSGYPMITWAGPLDMVRYDINNNPNKLKKQLLHTTRSTTSPVTGETEDDDVVVYYDGNGEPHILMTEDDITRVFEYIQNEETEIWGAVDGKQDKLTAGNNILIEKDETTGVTTISAVGSGAAYTAGANIQISPTNVISATDTKYYAGQNITINDQNIISAIIDLTNYYNKTEVNQLISDLDSISMQVVGTLPTTGASNIIYLVQRQGENIYDQWVYSDNQWFNIGDTEIDLSAYYTKTQADAKFQEILSDGTDLASVTDSTKLSSVRLTDKEVDGVTVEKIWDYMWDKIYPVGSIYTTIANDDPATLFGGTWEIVGENRVLWGVGASGTPGTTLSEQLPNLQGWIGGMQSYNKSGNWGRGVFADSAGENVGSNNQNASAEMGFATINFNAKNSNSVYTDNGIVRPNAYTVKFWRRTA